MTTKDLLSVGVVLSAKDMYHGIFDKARADLKRLNADAKDQAAQFERSLTLGKGLVIAGGTMAVAGAGISRVFEDVVRTAGEQETNLNDILIAAGDQSEGYAERVVQALDRVKTRWAFSDADLAASVKDIGGRTRDYEGALTAVGVAAALARARKLKLSEATELLADRVSQQSDAEKTGLSLTERYQSAAAQLSVVQKALGSNSEMLGSFMGRMGAKTAAAGVSFGEVGALMMEMGRAGVSARTGMQPFEAMLDAMRTLPTFGNFGSVFPKYSRSGSIVDMLDEVKARLDQMPSRTEKLAWLNKTFGAGAEMVLSFTQNLDGIKKSKAELELAKYSDVAGKGAAQMGTWAGTQAQATTAAEQFKEMVGKYSVPVVMSLERRLIAVTQAVDDSPFWRSVLGYGMVGGGLFGEIVRVLGPLTAGLGLLVSWNTQRRIAIALETQLATAAGGTALAGGAGITGAASAGVAGVIGAAGGVASLVGIIIAAIGATAIQQAVTFSFGQYVAGKLGIPTYSDWVHKKGAFAPKDAGTAQYPRWESFLAPEPGFVGPPAPGAPSGGLNISNFQPPTAAGDVTVHVPLYLDGRVVADTVAKYTRRDSER